jgi:hypothetical protein
MPFPFEAGHRATRRILLLGYTLLVILYTLLLVVRTAD